jgi:hypothetical protein
MPTFPENWTLYVEAVGVPIIFQAVFTTGDTNESGTVTATGPLGATYSGTWSETPSPQGNSITFSLTREGASNTYQFSGFRVAYAMGGTFSGPASGGWSACASTPPTAQRELD